MTERDINAALSHMQKLGHDQSGWDTLYYDPSARAFWEVIYPQSQMHGGGPRELRSLSEMEARARYPEQIFRSVNNSGRSEAPLNYSFLRVTRWSTSQN